MTIPLDVLTNGYSEDLLFDFRSLCLHEPEPNGYNRVYRLLSWSEPLRANGERVYRDPRPENNEVINYYGDVVQHPLRLFGTTHCSRPQQDRLWVWWDANGEFQGVFAPDFPAGFSATEIEVLLEYAKRRMGLHNLDVRALLAGTEPDPYYDDDDFEY